MIDGVDEVQGWLEPRADEMAGLLEELVAIDTENPPGRGLGACGALLRDAIVGLGASAELIELAPSGELEDPCIVRGASVRARRRSTSTGTSTSSRRSARDQFGARSGRDGRIVGRGTADMKGGLVSMLYGAVAAAGDRPARTTAGSCSTLVCDEETGSAVGSGHLRDAGMIDPGAFAMLTAEPTGGVVWHASRGAITLRVGLGGRRRTWGRRISGSTPSSRWSASAEPLAELSRRAAGRARVDARRRWRGRLGGQLQRRAGLGLVLGRSADQSRGGPGRRGRSPDGHDHAGRRGRGRRRDDRCAAAPAVWGHGGDSPGGCSAVAVCDRGGGGRPAVRDCARARWRLAGTPSSASRRSRTEPGGSTSRTDPTSTSTRPRCGRCAAVYARFAGELLS